MKKNYSNILVVRTDRIGDLVLTTPAIQAIAEAFPQSKLTVLVAKDNLALVQGNPFIDEIMLEDRKNEHRGVFGFWRLVGEVKKRIFDCAVIFHTKRRTNLLCFLAGIPERVGYHFYKLGFLLTKKIPDTRHQGLKHEAQYCLDVLKILGVDADLKRPFLPLQPKAEEWACQFLAKAKVDPGKKIFAIHPGASCQTRRWPPQRFRELIQLLIPRFDCQFFLIGSSEFGPIAKAIQSQLDHPMIDLIGQTSVAQLVSLLKRCALLVSVDSGPVHVADALGIPVVCLFTRNQPGINPERWRPLGEKSRIVVTPFTGKMSFAKSQPVDSQYLELIKAEQVLQAVDALFKLC